MRSLFSSVLLASVLAQNGAGQGADVGVASAPPGWSKSGQDLHRGYKGLKQGDPLKAGGDGDLVLECRCRTRAGRVRPARLVAEPED